jgi:hypothetical protein
MTLEIVCADLLNHAHWKDSKKVEMLRPYEVVAASEVTAQFDAVVLSKYGARRRGPVGGCHPWPAAGAPS